MQIPGADYRNYEVDEVDEAVSALTDRESDVLSLSRSDGILSTFVLVPPSADISLDATSISISTVCAVPGFRGFSWLGCNTRDENYRLDC